MCGSDICSFICQLSLSNTQINNMHTVSVSVLAKHLMNPLTYFKETHRKEILTACLQLIKVECQLD